MPIPWMCVCPSAYPWRYLNFVWLSLPQCLCLSPRELSSFRCVLYLRLNIRSLRCRIQGRRIIICMFVSLPVSRISQPVKRHDWLDTVTCHGILWGHIVLKLPWLWELLCCWWLRRWRRGCCRQAASQPFRQHNSTCSHCGGMECQKHNQWQLKYHFYNLATIKTTKKFEFFIFPNVGNNIEDSSSSPC